MASVVELWPANVGDASNAASDVGERDLPRDHTGVNGRYLLSQKPHLLHVPGSNSTAKRDSGGQVYSNPFNHDAMSALLRSWHLCASQWDSINLIGTAGMTLELHVRDIFTLQACRTHEHVLMVSTGGEMVACSQLCKKWTSAVGA